MKLLLTVLTAAAAGFGFFAAGALVLEHLQTGEACPGVGPVALCFVVFVGYAMVLASFVVSLPWRVRLFYAGLTPVLLLATVGVASELIVSETCPRTESGIPKCYFSFGLAALILVGNAVRQRLLSNN